VDSVFTLPDVTAAGNPTEKASEQGETEGERLFFDFTRLLGPLTVKDKQEFGRSLAAWFTYSVKQL